MRGIYEWIRSMVFFLILLTVITNLLPKKAYETYFRLFAGILFLFLLLKPLMELSGMEPQIVAAFRQITFQNEAEWLRQEIEQADGKRMETLRQQYREMLETELREMAKEHHLQCQDVQVHVDMDSQQGVPGKLLSVTMTVAMSGQSETQAADAAGTNTGAAESDMTDTGAEKSDIRMSEYHAGKERRQDANRQMGELKKRIGETYGVESGNIIIHLKDQ